MDIVKLDSDLELVNVDNVSFLDDGDVEVTTIEGNVMIYAGLVKRIYIPKGTTNKSFVVDIIM